MTNSIAKRNQSEQSKVIAEFEAKAESIGTKLQGVLTNNAAINFTNGKALNAVREVNQAEIDRLNQEYVVRTQDVLNEQALDFLVKNSMINAPTLTSIVAGFELARASRADKLNEQRGFAVENIQRQTEIAESQIENAQTFNDVQSDAAREVAGIEQQNNRSGFAQQSVAVRADVSDQESREAEVRSNAQRNLEREDGQSARLDEIRERALNNPTQAITEAQRFAALGRGQSQTAQQVNTQPTTPATTQSTTTQTTPVQQVVTPSVITPTESEQDESLAPIDLNAVIPGEILTRINNRREELSIQNNTEFQPVLVGTKYVDVPQEEVSLVTGGEVSEATPLNTVTRQMLAEYAVPVTGDYRPELIPVSYEALSDDQKKIADRINQLGLQSNEMSLDEKQRVVQRRQDANDGQIVPFNSTEFDNLRPDVQFELVNERFDVLKNSLVESPIELTEPVAEQTDDVIDTPSDETILFSEGSLSYLNGLNDADDDVVIDIPALQSNLIERGLPVDSLTPEELQKILDEEDELNNGEQQ